MKKKANNFIEDACNIILEILKSIKEKKLENYSTRDLSYIENLFYKIYDIEQNSSIINILTNEIFFRQKGKMHKKEDIFKIIEYGDIKVFQDMINNCYFNINTHYDNNEDNLLQAACLYNRIEFVELLLQHRHINVNIQDKNLSSPLYVVCGNNNIKIAKLLLQQKNINVNIQNIVSNTPLNVACSHKNVEIVKLLLQHKDIDVDFYTRKGSYLTALDYACTNKNLEIVELLLKNGADIEKIKDSFSKHPINDKAIIKAILLYSFNLSKEYKKELIERL